MTGPMRAILNGLSALLAVLTVAPAVAADPAAESPTTSDRLALVGGRLIDGYGGEPLADSVVLVEGDRIAAVGRVGEVEIPDDAEVVSTEGMDVLPGLWDMHVHLMIVGHSDYDHWDSTYPDRFGDVVMPAAAEQLLRAGVTSARDLGAPLDDILDVRDRIAAGEIPGPTLYVSGPFLQEEPYPGTELFRWGIDGVADAAEKVERIAAAGVDVVKLIDQDRMAMDEVRAVVETAHEHGLPVVAHSHRVEEIRRGLEVGVDDFEHTGLGTAPAYPEEIMQALRERVASGSPLYWTPTISPLLLFEETRDNPERLDDPRWRRGLPDDIVADVASSLQDYGELPYYQLMPRRRPTLERKFSQLRDSGVTLLVGTDSGVPGLFHTDSTWREIETWVNDFGVPAMEALRAATYWPAVAMGVEEEVGTVTVGKRADLIAVRGDVLEHPALLSDVDFVVKSGRRIK